jgi:predicted site-specific integrase-resolvase
MLHLMPNDLIGSAEACRILAIDKATLSRWITAGQLDAAHKLPGPNGAYLFHRADINQLAAERASA